MKCQNCHKEIDDNTVFCGYCGARQVVEEQKEDPVVSETTNEIPEEPVITESKKKKKDHKGLATALLFISILCTGFLPDFLETILFAMAKKPLGETTVFLLNGLGNILGMVFFMGCIYLTFAKADVDKANGKTVRKLNYILGFFPFLFWLLVSRYLLGSYAMIIAAKFAGKQMLTFGLIGGGILLLTILMGMTFYGYITRCIIHGRKHSILWYFVSFIISFPMSVLLVLAFYSLPILELLREHFLVTQTLMIRFCIYVIAALISLFLMQGVFVLIRLMNGKKKQETEGKKAVSKAYYIFSGITALLCCLLIGMFPARKLLMSPFNRFKSEIGQYGAAYAERLAFMDLDGAVSVADRSQTVIDCYLAAAGKNDGFSMEDAVKAYPHDAEILYLYGKTSQNTTWMESYLRIRGDQSDSEVALGLLDVYKGLESLSDSQKEYQRIAKQICAQKGLYTLSFVNPASLEKKGEVMKDALKEASFLEEDGQVLKLYVKYKESNDNGREVISEAMDLSKEYPDNMTVQYIAAMIGTSLTYDNASHYEDTRDALLRYKDLYEEKNKPDEKTKNENTLDIARKLMDIYQYEDAASCIESVDPIMDYDGATEMLCECYQKLGLNQEALKVAKEYCDKKEDSPYLLYYAALCSLKLVKTDDAITYGSKLASHVESCQEEDINQCESYLYNLLNYMTLNDNGSYTDYSYKIYDTLTDAQNQTIDANPFFRNYMDAVSMAYSRLNEEELATALAKIDAVLESNPNLASAWYVKGTILANTDEEKDMEAAVEAFKKAGSLNPKIPAVWYAMAKVYESMNKYEDGIDACQKALALLPEQDHGEDWYGIHIHCTNLLNSMLNKINQ